MWKPIVSLLARLGLAAVWLISGWAKASDAQESMVAVRAYDLVPESMVRTVAIGLPSLELALGLLLLLGLGVRWTAVVSALLLLVLIAGVAAAWARGLQIACGCVGGGGAVAGEPQAQRER
ncbi:MAG: DoxX family membrane protein, partial [Tomitella sp.]|nr:DoxX family membrane protein [Tomitella sp.]